jgi:hypothetical protein
VLVIETFFIAFGTGDGGVDFGTGGGGIDVGPSETGP